MAVSPEVYWLVMGSVGGAVSLAILHVLANGVRESIRAHDLSVRVAELLITHSEYFAKLAREKQLKAGKK